MTLSQALNETYMIISNILEKDPVVLVGEYSGTTLNCTEFSLLMNNSQKVYMQALQLESLAREYERNSNDTLFLANQLMLDEIAMSVKGIRKYKDAIVISTKNDMHEYCPSYEQMEEARKLNGLLFSCML